MILLSAKGAFSKPGALRPPGPTRHADAAGRRQGARGNALFRGGGGDDAGHRLPARSRLGGGVPDAAHELRIGAPTVLVRSSPSSSPSSETRRVPSFLSANIIASETANVAAVMTTLPIACPMSWAVPPP